MQNDNNFADKPALPNSAENYNSTHKIW